MNVTKILTSYNKTTKSSRNIKYIVIHYVGATGSAKANCEYYASKYIGASAHYFVNHDGSVFQSVEDKDVAWHCGAKSYKHKECRNANSIGIELCVRKENGKWRFEEETVKAGIELTKELMKKYNIPASNVIRHYDVTGKICPEPFVSNQTAWNDFKSKLTTTATPKESIVTRLQKELNASYKAGLKVDGIFGPKTLAACPTLKKGSKNNVVKILQERLKITIDGSFGPDTEYAVKLFQIDKLLIVDGVVGKKTWNKLF